MNKEEQAAYNEALRMIRACRAEGNFCTHLELCGLGLTSLPAEIGSLTALKVLSLSNNRLKALPAEIGKLSSLRELSLLNNRLTTLPEQISQLTALRELSVSDNELTSLPEQIINLTALKQLYLHGNPKLGIPDSVLGPNLKEVYWGGANSNRPNGRPSDILSFYFERLRAAEAGRLRMLNEIKVMLVGDGGAGKTSLRRFFMGEQHMPKELETLGIALGAFSLFCGKAKITVRLWDFAGQEITHALHQFFLTEGCVYIVVVDPRSDNEESDAERWLELIERYGNGAPALVVMNKQDTRQPKGYDLDRNRLRERFPFIVGFAPTSCETKEHWLKRRFSYLQNFISNEATNSRLGCEELREQLRVVLRAMPEANLEVDESWVRVKDACFTKGRAGKERHYLSLDEFRALCAEHGEHSSEKQESLARILHNLGAVLHFVDEPRLRDTTVLNPHWVTDGTYRLLRCKDGPGSDGTLTLAEAMVAVAGADEKATRYLLGLMERFEMCFTLEEADGQAQPARRWLVPGALGKNQPDAVKAGDWREQEAVRLRYHYDPLPQGVLPRFIVMTHLLSDGQPRWRFGVILRDREASALIRKGAKENTVEVTVQGAEVDREKLVKTVRGYLARIHCDLPEPRPKEFQELSGTGEYREVRQMRADERRGVPIVVETPQGDVEKSATEELNRSSAQSPRTGKKRPLRIFLSYSHEDKRAQGLFRKNLMALESDGYITFWDDPNIKAGMEWRAEIDRELETMDIFVGLLTTNFHTSNFIQRVEFDAALRWRKLKTAELWLVLVDDRRIAGTPYAKFQVMMPDGKAASLHKRGLKGGFDAVEKEMCARVERLWAAQPDR